MFGRLNNIDLSLRAFPGWTGSTSLVLSDTRDPEIRRAEQAAFEHFLKSSGQEGRLFYRLRTDNTGARPAISPNGCAGSAAPMTTWWCWTPTA